MEFYRAEKKAKKNNNNENKNHNSKIKKKKNTKKKNNKTLTKIHQGHSDNQHLRESNKGDIIQKTSTFFVKKKANALNLSKKEKERKFSAANNGCDENEKIINNNTIDFDFNKKKEKQKKITFKLGEDFSILINDNNNDESEDINLLDDYLYNKKIKRIKITKKISHKS